MTEVEAPVETRLSRHAARMTLAGIAQRAAGAVGGVIAAHLLSPAGRGTYAILMLLGSGVALLLTSGMQFWVVRAIAADPKDPRTRAVVMRHLAVASAIVAAGTAGALAFCPASLAGNALVVGALAIANVFSLIYLGVAVGQHRSGVAAMAMGLGAAGSTGWLVIALLGHMDTPALISVSTLAWHVVAVTACLAGSRALPGEVSTRSSDAVLAHREALSSNIAAGFGELILLTAFRADVALVAALGSPTEAGLYAVATSLAELLWLVPDAVATVVLPHVAADPGRSVRRPLLGSVGAMLVIGLPLLIAPGPIIAIVFGEDYRAAQTAVPWLVLSAVLLGVWKIESAVLVAVGRGSMRLLSAVAAAAVALTGDLWLIPGHGFNGAAWSCAAGYGAAALVTRVASSRLPHQGEGTP